MDQEIYQNYGHILKRGITAPKTGWAAIDRGELAKQLARGNCEMVYNINKGTYPIFGYPLVCLDYKEGNTGCEKTPSELWQLMFKSTMKFKKGQNNEIGSILDGHDQFIDKQSRLMSSFTKSKDLSGKPQRFKSSSHLDRKRMMLAPHQAMALRGVKERP